MRTRAFVLGLALAVAGCAGNPAPRAWLPGASDALRSGYGGWLRLDLRPAPDGSPPQSIEGEFLALGSDSILRILTEGGVREPHLLQIARARLTGYDVEETVSLWTFPGGLVTAGNGVAAVLTFPAWILAGAGSTRSAWSPAKASVPGRTWNDMCLYARFPQGWPTGLSPALLHADERWPGIARQRRDEQRRLERDAKRAQE